MKHIYTVDEISNAPTSSGVYAIHNTVNGHIYFGSSINIRERWQRHLRDLRLGVHTNPHLQNAFNRYGEDNFHFIVSGVYRPEDILEYEQKWLDVYQNELGWERCYNICPTASNRLGVSDSAAAKKKRSRSMKRKWENPQFAQEMRAKLREGIKAKLKSYKFVSPAGELVEITDLRSFCKESDLCVSKMVAVSKGRRFEHKGWVSGDPAIIEQYAGVYSRLYYFRSPSGELYCTGRVKEFAKQHGLNSGCLYQLIHKQAKQHKGWTLANAD